MADQPLTITITEKDDRIPVESFITIAGETIGILRAIDKHVSKTHAGSLVWCVKGAAKSSPLTLTIAGEPRAQDDAVPDVAVPDVAVPDVAVPDVAGLFLGAVEIINDRAEWPTQLPVEGFDKLRKIGSLVDGGLTIAFSCNGKRVAPTQHINANIAVILDEHSEWTTIEGRLDAVTAHKRQTFRLYDRLTGGSTECRFKTGLKESVRKGLYGRVSVFGQATYRAGKPISILVESLDVLEDVGIAFDDLPQIDITGGVPSEEHVRKVRDGE